MSCCCVHVCLICCYICTVTLRAAGNCAHVLCVIEAHSDSSCVGEELMLFDRSVTLSQTSLTYHLFVASLLVIREVKSIHWEGAASQRVSLMSVFSMGGVSTEQWTLDHCGKLYSIELDTLILLRFKHFVLMSFLTWGVCRRVLGFQFPISGF